MDTEFIKLSKIKSILENKVCKEHNQRPTITIDNSNLTISCCCDVFKEIINKSYANELDKQAKAALNNLFKK